MEFSPLCILVGISCLQKRLTKSNKGRGHNQPQTFVKFSKPYFLHQCHQVLVLCFANHNIFTFLHPIVAFKVADINIPGKEAQWENDICGVLCYWAIFLIHPSSAGGEIWVGITMKAIALASNCVIAHLNATLYDQIKILTDTDTTSLFCSKTFQSF